MARTVNALYDTRQEAEVAQARLSAEAGLADSRILTKASAGEFEKLDLSDEDRRKYSEGLDRGACLLTAEVKGSDDPERLIRILKEAARSDATRASALGAGAHHDGEARTLAEERIPVVEEELRIGKREVERGGARVQSRVREDPAEADITLKQERLEVERRSSGRFMSDADVQAGGLLKARVIEISEMREIPVINKEAVVREELVVKKTVEERTETVHDTVRRTEVDVEEIRDRPPVR